MQNLGIMIWHVIAFLFLLCHHFNLSRMSLWKNPVFLFCQWRLVCSVVINKPLPPSQTLPIVPQPVIPLRPPTLPATYLLMPLWYRWRWQALMSLLPLKMKGVRSWGWSMTSYKQSVNPKGLRLNLLSSHRTTYCQDWTPKLWFGDCNDGSYRWACLQIWYF